MHRRSKARGILVAGTLGLVAVAAIAVVAVVQSGAAGGSERHRQASGSRRSTVPVPEVVGLSEANAVRALGAAGLVANVRYVKDAPRTGAVLRADPAAGNNVPARSVILLSIALGPRLPDPGPGHEEDLRALSTVVEDTPSAFVGLYRDGQGVPHVVFGPGVDLAPWAPRLRKAAGGIRYVTDRCARSRADLRAVQDAVAAKHWTSNRSLPFGVAVDPVTCTVRVASDLLTSHEIKALVDRFGTAISIDTTKGSHPELLSGR
jgi:PASTA domain